MAYADWEFYEKNYSIVTGEATFERLAAIASRKMDVFTGRRAAAATGYKADALRDCVCNMVDYLHLAEQGAQGRGVTSVSNDGYSETYQATTPEAVEENLRSVAFQWLSGTGLMGAL